MASTPARDESFYRSRFSPAFSSIRAGASSRERRGLLLATFLITTVLSLGYFGQSLWRDEASSVWFARLPLTTLLTALCDPHPPGYYVLLKAWLIGGEQEFWLRLPSLLAAVLGVAFTYRLAREACGYRCAWLAALLLALHPLQSWYAAEIRMYMLIQALGLLLVWLGWRLLTVPAQQPPRRREMVAYWLVAVIALGLDYAALLPIGLLQLLWLARGLPDARRWLSLQAAVLLPAALLWSNFSQLQALPHSYPAVFVAVQASYLGFDLTPAAAASLLQFVVIGLAATCLALAWYGFHRSGRWLDRPLVQLLWLGGWLALLLLAALPRAYTVKRQLVVLLPYLALLVSYGLARLPRPTGELLAGLGLLVTLLVLPNHQREPWRAIVANLVQTEPNQATVIWVDEQSVPAFDYYLRNGGAAAEPIRWTPFFGGSLPQLPGLAPRPGGTLWIVTVESAYRHLIVLLPEDFYRHYQLLEERYEAGIGLHRYRRQASFTSSRSHWTEPDRLAEWGLLLPSPLDTCQPYGGEEVNEDS